MDAQELKELDPLLSQEEPEPDQHRLQNIKMKLSSISKAQFAVIVVAVLVEIIYISKGVLLVYRYLQRSNVCGNHTIQPAEDDSLEIERDDCGYNFTVFLCGMISLLQCIEYIPLFMGLWQYCDKMDMDRPNDKIKCKHNNKQNKIIWFMLLIPVWIICLSIPAVGLSLENRCGDAKVMANAYCIINFFHYTWAFSVRMGMIFATLKVKEIWNDALADIQNANEDNTMSRHASPTDIYTNTGEQVKKVAKIFETWFLFPWIIFFLVSSLKSLLNEDEGKVLPLVYFMLYNINPFLIIPYLCARKMNHYHHKCVLKIQKKQPNTEKEDDEFVAEQQKLLIQVNEKYDLEPCICGVGFKFTSFSCDWSLQYLLQFCTSVEFYLLFTCVITHVLVYCLEL